MDVSHNMKMKNIIIEEKWKENLLCSQQASYGFSDCFPDFPQF